EAQPAAPVDEPVHRRKGAYPVRRPVLVALVALVLVAPAAAATSGPPPVQATSFLVETEGTGDVLASRSAPERGRIASIRKPMTVYIGLQRQRLTGGVTVDPRAAAVGESTADLEPGERLMVSDLVKAALIQSANDAADALALSVSPSFESFATLMNRTGA